MVLNTSFYSVISIHGLISTFQIRNLLCNSKSNIDGNRHSHIRTPRIECPKKSKICNLRRFVGYVWLFLMKLWETCKLEELENKNWSRAYVRWNKVFILQFCNKCYVQMVTFFCSVFHLRPNLYFLSLNLRRFYELHKFAQAALKILPPPENAASDMEKQMFSLHQRRALHATETDIYKKTDGISNCYGFLLDRFAANNDLI